MSTTGSTVQSVLSSVISTGKSAIRKVEVGQIQRFIEAQPEVVGKVRILQIGAGGEVGASSGIVLFSARIDTGSGPQDRDLVLRHAPGSETRLFFEYDLARQFRVQKALQDSGVPVPEPLWLDASGEYLGVPGYIMVQVSGIAPNPSAFVKGPLADATPERREAMLDEVMRALVGIHRCDLAARGLADFSMNAQGDTPLQKCINWYWQTWDWIQLPEYARLQSVRRWLLDREPAGTATLTHGDSTLHNYLFKDHRLVAVLDWEMSCLARPEADLALQCVGNELFAAPPECGLLQPPSQEQWLQRYERAGGQPPAHFDYFRKLAAYMIVVAVQSLQRNMPAEQRAAQRPFIDRLWAQLES